jgi:ribosomal protein S18 acetylase RimI-like enzyme
VDLAVQGQGLGERLLLDALERILAASRNSAAYAVEVIAINDAAKRFYLKYGFQALLDDKLHLYLPMKTITTLFEER